VVKWKFLRGLSAELVDKSIDSKQAHISSVINISIDVPGLSHIKRANESLKATPGDPG
jgi:hypothetical protein